MPSCLWPWPGSRLALASVVAVAFWLGLPGAVQAQPQPQPPAPPPALDFVRHAQVHEASISPSGRHVAFVLRSRYDRYVLAVRSLAEGAELKTLMAFTDADVHTVAWVNDERLVFEVYQPGTLIAHGGAGTFAVDLDGQNRKQLIAWVYDDDPIGTHVPRDGLPYGWYLAGTVDDGSDDVLVQSRTRDIDGDGMLDVLARVNTRSGLITRLNTGAPLFTVDWVLDPQNTLRVVRTERNGRSRLHWRPPGSDDWKLVHNEPQLDAGVLRPAFLENDGSLIVEGRHGRDTSALFAMDLASGRLDPEPLAALNGFDIDASLAHDSRSRQVMGVHTLASRPVSVWFDERLAGIQAAVDQALPGRYNQLRCGRCQSTQHFVVRSQADKHPGDFLHYDHGKRQMRVLGAHRPWLPPQGRRSFHRVAARDGLTLPVVVTHPPGLEPDARPARALPTVLWVHGGPWERGSDTRWSDTPQFLASRGYRVLEVDFRGSTGLGWRHFQAGWKQWGTAMQDDLADALAWAVREGLSDARRVCVGGASYGGYAALMSLIRHPALYRCGISFAGVTDPGLLYSASRGDMSEEAKRFSLPVLVGDPKADAELMKAASPLARVAEIQRPVLLAWGLLDRRVPPEHAERFVSAARKADVAVQTMVFPKEGHGFNDPRKHADFLERVETFLARQLAP